MQGLTIIVLLINVIFDIDNNTINNSVAVSGWHSDYVGGKMWRFALRHTIFDSLDKKRDPIITRIKDSDW